jgi:hypothetical protein
MGKETYCIDEFRDDWCGADNTVAGWNYEAWSLEMAIAIYVLRMATWSSNG